MNRLLIALCVLQTALLVFLGVRMMDIDARTNEIALAAQGFSNETTQLKIAQADSARRSAGTTETIFLGGPSAEEIREIVREEIAAAGMTGASSARRPAPPRQRSEEEIAEIALLKKTIVQDLDYFTGLGRINEAEMIGLQQKIAKLPPEERGAMLGKLGKALSTGGVQGRL